MGLDDSISSGEIEERLAEIDGCKIGDIKVGQLRPMNNGLFMAWAQCPLATAIKASASGKMKIGWTVARIELLKARPVQCFRCWEQGHLKSKCTSLIDRSKLCYRCGEEGHPARMCGSEFKCAICASQGKDARHRVGSGLCKPDPGPKATEMKQSRRDDNMEVVNG